MKVMIEWTIRRHSGSVIRRFWTPTDKAGEAQYESLKKAGRIPQSSQLIFEIKRVVA